MLRMLLCFWYREDIFHIRISPLPFKKKAFAVFQVPLTQNNPYVKGAYFGVAFFCHPSKAKANKQAKTTTTQNRITRTTTKKHVLDFPKISPHLWSILLLISCMTGQDANLSESPWPHQANGGNNEGIAKGSGGLNKASIRNNLPHCLVYSSYLINTSMVWTTLFLFYPFTFSHIQLERVLKLPESPVDMWLAKSFSSLDLCSEHLTQTYNLSISI